jgi:hypothetical protein
MNGFGLGKLKGLFGGGVQAISERAPTPQSFGGPIVDLGLGVVSTGMGLGQKLSTTAGETFEAFQESTAETIVGGLDPVFGEGAPLDISAPAKAGDYAGALAQLPISAGKTITQPITQAGQSLTLPLLALAGILLLK